MTEKIGSAGVEVGAAAGAGAGWDRGEDETRLDIGHTRMLNLASRETNCVTLVWQGDGRIETYIKSENQMLLIQYVERLDGERGG
jgi:hypothetical protein